ncbi:MAG: hypothetical protein Q9212_001378 [Teloschistes hypoglaucus]
MDPAEGIRLDPVYLRDKDNENAFEEDVAGEEEQEREEDWVDELKGISDVFARAFFRPGKASMDSSGGSLYQHLMKDAATAARHTKNVGEDRKDGSTDQSHEDVEESTTTVRPVSVERFLIDGVFPKNEKVDRKQASKFHGNSTDEEWVHEKIVDANADPALFQNQASVSLLIMLGGQWY